MTERPSGMPPTNTPELKVYEGTKHYAVVKGRRYLVFPYTALYEVPVMILPDGNDQVVRSCSYKTVAKCRTNGDKKKLEVKTSASGGNGGFDVAAKKNDPLLGPLKQRDVPVITISDKALEKIKTNEIVLTDVGGQ